MGREVGRVDNYIIEVDEQMVVDLGPQAALHEPLECSWGVAEAEWHPVKLVEAEGRREGGLHLILWCHLHLPISAGQI